MDKGMGMIGTGRDRGTVWLARGNLRPTRQRLALATLLVGDGENRHVTAESLYALAASCGEKVSLATVYNTLRAFCTAGLMNEVVVDGARSYFDTRMDDHHISTGKTATTCPMFRRVRSGFPACPKRPPACRLAASMWSSG